MSNKENLYKCLQILDEATQPQNAGKISREGYVAVSQALQLFKEHVDSLPLEETQKEKE